MKIGKPLAMLVAIVCCAACEYAPDMLDRTIAYNRTVANSTNQVLLLNIVRASQRLPTYYTRLEGDASSLSLTPNTSLSLPLSNPRSFENDINTSPTGAVTSATTKAIGSLASIVGTLGLQASESNLMTLQTLDDQKYQNGMMTPVPLKNIQAFQDEGYQRDLLFMMFLSSIQVSNELMDTIDAAVVARCGQMAAGAGAISFDQQLCVYMSSGPYQLLFDPERAHPAAYSFSLRTCQATGGAVGGNAPTRWCGSTTIRRAKAAGNPPATRIRKSVSRSCSTIFWYWAWKSVRPTTFPPAWWMSFPTPWRKMRNSAPR